MFTFVVTIPATLPVEQRTRAGFLFKVDELRKRFQTDCRTNSIIKIPGFNN
jgi:hypothetical protein